MFFKLFIVGIGCSLLLVAMTTGKFSGLSERGSGGQTSLDSVTADDDADEDCFERCIDERRVTADTEVRQLWNFYSS